MRGTSVWGLLMSSLLSACYLQIDAQSPQGQSLRETNAMLAETGENWLYGPGVGETAMNVGIVAAFPPYAALLLSNAALSLSGYETIGVGSFLNEESEREWDHAFDTFVSGPGRVSAAVAGTPYRTREEVTERSRALLEKQRAQLKFSKVEEEQGEDHDGS